MKQLIHESTAVLHQGTAILQTGLLQWVIPFVAAFGTGFLLAGCRIMGQVLPVGVGFAAALRLSAAGLGAAMGSGVGYALLWGPEAGLPSLCVLFLLLAGSAIFHSTTLMDHRWFMPTLAGILTLLVELVTISGLSQPMRTVFLLGRPLIAAGSCVLLRLASEQKRCGRIAAAGCMIGGLAPLVTALPFNPAVAAAFALISASDDREQGLPWAAAAGIGLDCAAVMRMPMTAALCVFRLFFRTMPLLRSTILRRSGIGLCAAGAVIFWLVFPMALPLSACIGIGVGLCFPVPAAPPRGTHPYARVRKQMGQLCVALDAMRQTVSDADAEEPPLGAEPLYDHVAERVCKCCVRFRTCWGTDAAETYRALQLASTAVLSKGQAASEDFPSAFFEQCRHSDAFTAAINRELDELRSRRQYHSRCMEQQQLLLLQLDILSHMIRRSTHSTTPVRPPKFRLESGFCSVCSDDSKPNGDQWTSVQIHAGRCCILLSDGMGTGAEAAQESALALQLLGALLKAGAAVSEALQLLNSLYILRRNSAFAAIDILDIDLVEGSAGLHKWGGAACYWKHNALVKKYGLASPPPGISLKDREPETYAMDLAHRQTLLLTTDGVSTPDTAEQISSYSGTNLDSLAACLIESARLRNHDDMTVVAVRLCPLHGST